MGLSGAIHGASSAHANDQGHEGEAELEEWVAAETIGEEAQCRRRTRVCHLMSDRAPFARFQHALQTEFKLVLSGGGLKGLSHVGVLMALEERGLVPSLVVGSSMGAMVAATWATGMSVAEMHARAIQVKRRHVFAVAHADMALRRMQAPAVYRREPLELLLNGLVADLTFRDLPRQLLVNTVDLNSGAQVLWGLPGLDDVRVADAVFASCALPGILPPRLIRGRYYVDGAVVENLPLRIAATAGPGPIIAVNLNPLGPFDLERSDTESQGFAATYIRGLEMVMQAQSAEGLRFWQWPPLMLVQPRVGHISMFAFDRTEELIEEGYRSMSAALDLVGGPWSSWDRGFIRGGRCGSRWRRRSAWDAEPARSGRQRCSRWGPTARRM